MRTRIFLLVFIIVSTLTELEAQNNKWYVEAGPYVGVAAWTFSVGHSLGIGADARVARDFGSGFSGGGKVTYAYFFGKKIAGNGPKVSGVSMAGVYANLQYVHDGKYVAGGDIGLGFSAADGNSETGFARTGYLGYQWKQQDNLLTIAAYLNRTTIATYNIGIRTWYRF